MTRSRPLGGALSCILAAAIIAALVVVGAVANAATPAPAPAPTVVYKTMASGWVLYTVNSGTYKDAVTAYDQLRRLRDDMGLVPANDTGTFVYLSDPNAGEQLIEIQLPVTAASAKAAQGTLARMAGQYDLGTTDVKQLPQRFVATTTKSVGTTDSTNSWKALYRQLATDGFSTAQAPQETFNNISAIPLTCAYDELETSVSLVLE